jgi:hypothetical protein
MLDESLFVSETVHEREITLGDGTTHKLCFREISAAEFRKLQTSAKGNDEQAELAASRVIARSMCNPDGTDCLTVEQAGKLKQGIRLALSLAIAEVNGVGASVGKVSPPEVTSGSGTSSS